MKKRLAIALIFSLALGGCQQFAQWGDRGFEAAEEGVDLVNAGVTRAGEVWEKGGENRVGRARETQKSVQKISDESIDATNEASDDQLEAAHKTIRAQGARIAAQVRFQCADLAPGTQIKIAQTDIVTVCPDSPEVLPPAAAE